jgi:hypothetical protein
VALPGSEDVLLLLLPIAILVLIAVFLCHAALV